MKKVLMLGGAYNQVPSIKKAIEMGFYTITCDYLPNNPGHKLAHEYHNVSTTDKEAVLELAQRLKVDGVVCYACDPAAPTAAYVCEKMGLPTSPYKAVEILSNKDMFRQFLKENGFKTPKAKGYTNIEDAVREIGEFNLPVIIKPVDSSGSKGITKLEDVSKLREQIKNALSFSRAKRFVIEEFIERKGCLLMGDGFSVNGELVFRCFGDDNFDETLANPLVPIYATFPSNRPKELQDKVHAEFQRLLTLVGMKNSAYNLEAFITPNDDVILMEAGPRCGGDFVPQAVEHVTGVDLVEYTIRSAMGMDCSDLKMVEADKGFAAYYVIHSRNAGILKELWIDDDFRKNNLDHLEMALNPGDEVKVFTGSHTTLGVMVLKFSSEQEMTEKTKNMSKYVKVVLE